ncbi:UNVERIFIED_CONTAM: Mitochondrial outer membrane import complex protein METAXIN [Sesamum calycinum]|uniref:Mitochondrial outer membrane import complex protein METAXIN n=1 Tax=Sesamum calycinum TaxID=2727403 RepID=A0AAW2N100_9LAMI
MEDGGGERERLTLVARKPCFGLPTACPKSLPVYIYLRFSKIPFSLEFNLIHPDSDQIPFVESGDYVAYNNEKGGVIPNLKEDGIVDLDSEVSGIPEWVSIKAMVESWLADAVMYELWVGCDDNADRREEEIYSRAALAYGALSSRPTSLDAAFLGHVLFVLHALPETSVLRSKLLSHSNLVSYAENLKMEYVDANLSSSSVPQSDPSSSASKRGPSHWSSKPRSKAKREKTEEEKKFRRRAKYFLATQLVAVLIFLSLLGGSSDTEVELGDDDDGLIYD